MTQVSIFNGRLDRLVREGSHHCLHLSIYFYYSWRLGRIWVMQRSTLVCIALAACSPIGREQANGVAARAP